MCIYLCRYVGLTLERWTRQQFVFLTEPISSTPCSLALSTLRQLFFLSLVIQPGTAKRIFLLQAVEWQKGQQRAREPRSGNRAQRPCKKRNRSHTQPHNKNNTTHHMTRQEQHHKRPHEEPPTPALNNDRRWRGDGAYHLPHPGGWKNQTLPGSFSAGSSRRGRSIGLWRKAWNVPENRN